MVLMAITRACAASTFASGLEGVPQLLVRSNVAHLEKLRKLQHTIPQVLHVRVLPNLATTPTDEALAHVILVDVIDYLL